MTPCAPWTTAEDVAACPPYDNLDGAAVALGVTAATEVLFALTGRQFPGPCTDTVRPTGQCGGRGGCRPRLHLVPLGVSPIVSVESVTVAGVELDPSEYRILDSFWLVRADGSSWPCCPDVLAEPAAFEVEFTWGQEPPGVCRTAARVLAGEIARSLCGDDSCALDRRVQNITRQGVSMQMALPGLVDSLSKGLTGIAEVDLAVLATNPNRLDRPPSILVPGVDPVAHRVSPVSPVAP